MNRKEEESALYDEPANKYVDSNGISIDTDRDGTPDCLDNCPNDRNKTELGDCGCGNRETDRDGDL